MVPKRVPERVFGERNVNLGQEVILPDYVMLDFADDFFPEETSNLRLRKPHASAELFG